MGKESEKTDKRERESAKERRAQEQAGILRTTAPVSDKKPGISLITGTFHKENTKRCDTFKNTSRNGQ